MPETYARKKGINSRTAQAEHNDLKALGPKRHAAQRWNNCSTCVSLLRLRGVYVDGRPV